MTLVVDASVAVAACDAVDGWAFFGRTRLVAPRLMWSEARSTLHLAASRGRRSRAAALEAAQRLEHCPVEAVEDEAAGAQAWRIADELGWGRTYDAEYVALARLLRCRVVTLDGRLRRGADRLGLVVGPSELGMGGA